MSAKKRLLSILMAVTMVFTMMPMTAFADTEPDMIQPDMDYESLDVSISGGETTATVGDTVTLSIYASDDRAIGSVRWALVAPVTGKKTWLDGEYMGTDYDTKNGLWQAAFDVTEETENGIWKTYCIELHDAGGNGKYCYNMKMNSGYGYDYTGLEFEVNGTPANPDPDLTKPEMDYESLDVSISGGDTAAMIGDTVTLSFYASDDRAVSSVRWGLITPATGRRNWLDGEYMGTDYDTRNGLWQTTFNITEETENGIWKTYCIELHDTSGNGKYFYNMQMNSGYGYDYTGLEFEVIAPECPLDLTTPGYSMMLDGTGATTTFGGNYYVTEFDETVTPDTKVRFDGQDGTWTTLPPRKYTLYYEQMVGEDSWEDYTNTTFGIGTYRVSATGREFSYYTGTVGPVEFNVIKQHKVTFDSLGGSEVAPQCVIPGETAADPEKPKRDGYLFAGWCADEELTEPFDFNTAITDDITLYADWRSDVTLTIGVYDQTNGVSGQGGTYTFNDEDMTHTAYKHSVKVGSAVKLAAAPAEGYWFKGWYLGRVSGDGDSLNIVPENMELFEGPVLDLTAEAEYVLCAVFKENTDTPPEIDISTLQVDVPEEREGDRIVTAGDQVTISVRITDLDTIKKALAWCMLYHYADEEDPEEYWMYEKIRLSKQENDIWTGTFEIKEDTVRGTWWFGYVETEDEKKNESGYYNSDVFEHTYSPCTDLSAFDFTVEKSYTVTFDSRGGSEVAAQKVISGKKAAKPANPTRDGWHFGHWYMDEEGTNEYNFYAAVTEDITLYGDWYTYMAMGVYNRSNPGIRKCGTVDIETSKQNISYQDAGTMNFTVPEGSMKFTAKPAAGAAFIGWYRGIVGPSSFVEEPSDELLCEETEYICDAAEEAVCAVFECADHQWEEKIQKATPDAAGRIYQVCSLCGEEETVVLLPKVSSITLEKTAYSYTGKAIKPTVTVANASEVLSADCYTVEYSDNVNVGKAAALVKLKGDYYEGSRKLTFMIEKAAQTVTVPNTSYTKTYGDAAFSLGAKTTGDGTLKYSSDNTKVATVSSAGKVTIKGVGTARITVYAAAGTNYKKSANKTVTVKVNKAAQTVTVKASASSVAAGQTATLETTAKGTVTYSSDDSTIAGVNKTTGVITARKVGTVKITATAAATAEYNKGTKTITIKVVPAATAEFKATNTASGIRLTWKKVTGATKYYIERNGEALNTTSNGDTLTYTDKTANVNGTKYVYKINAYASTGKGAGKSVTRYFVTRPTLSSAASSAAKKAAVKWKKVAKTSGYQIQYSTSATFASGNKTVTVEGGSVVSKVIDSLTSGKTYYVRVRAYKQAGSAKHYSAWSPKQSVKIK